MQLHDKEKQLVELRDRLKEIEALMGSGRSMTEEQRLLQKQKQLVEENKRETQELIEKHEIRVRQLIQETVDLRWVQEFTDTRSPESRPSVFVVF